MGSSFFYGCGDGAGIRRRPQAVRLSFCERSRETLGEVNPGNPHSRDASADPPTPFFASVPDDYISSASSFSVSTTSCGYACSTFSASAIALLLSSFISASMSAPAIVSYASSVSAAGT